MSDSENPGNIAAFVLEQLEGQGLDLGIPCCGKDGQPQVKVVCVAPNLHSSVEQLGKSARNQVVMVRIDGETSAKLDAWVETGVVKSRSEAAALFIREGLGVREAELDELDQALREVTRAKEQLQQKAGKILGQQTGEE